MHPHSSTKILKFTSLLAALISMNAIGQTLNEAINFQLSAAISPCSNLLGADEGRDVLTGGLDTICNRFVPAGSVPNSQGASTANTQSLAGDARGLLQNARGETGVSQELTANWSFFANIEHETLNHDATALADGFDSDALRVNAGVNYAFTANNHLGIAFVSKTHDGDYQAGGDFSSDSIGARLIADFGLTENTFAQILLGRDNTDLDRSRKATFFDTANGGVIYSLSASPKSAYSGTETEAAAVLGGSWLLGGTTLSPTLGVNWQQIDYDTHSEAGNSGLEITTYANTADFLQAIIGLQASWAVSADWGVWAPQLGASVINEFENKSRQLQVSFTGDARAKRFTYDTEEGDSSYMTVSAGSVFLLKNGVQFYVNAEQYVGFADYTRTVFSGGFRWEL